MSELRKQLQAARDAYRQAKYPGNLADELLPTKPTVSTWRWMALAGAIAAAVAVVALWPGGAGVDAPPTVAQVEPTEVEPFDDGAFTFDEETGELETVSYVIEEIPSLPSIGSMWADAGDESNESIEPIVPSFPSMNEWAGRDTATSEGE